MPSIGLETMPSLISFVCQLLPRVAGRGQQVDARQRLGVAADVVDVVRADPADRALAQQVRDGGQLDGAAESGVDHVALPLPRGPGRAGRATCSNHTKEFPARKNSPLARSRSPSPSMS